jgi:polysaccharide export outer membrane protein
MSSLDSTHFRGRARARRLGAGKQRAAVLLVGVALVAAFGCSTTLAPSPRAETQPTYIVGAPDTLSVTIMPEPAEVFSVLVRPDGKISIPLVGDMPAGGRTIEEIASDIEQRMSRFKRGAQVSVALVAAASTDITVLGEVGSPSSFPLVKATRIVEAIGQVGGIRPFASAGKIRVVRSGDNRETVVHLVDLKAIRSGDLSTNLLLMPGDVVYVPPTILARVGYVVQQLLFPFQPVLGVAQIMGGNLLTP